MSQMLFQALIHHLISSLQQSSRMICYVRHLVTYPTATLLPKRTAILFDILHAILYDLGSSPAQLVNLDFPKPMAMGSSHWQNRSI